jgi:ankyrin repeat protein
LNAPNPEDENNVTALMEAAAEGQLEVVMALINELGVDRLRRDARGANCLHYAAGNGRVKVVMWLVGDGGMQIGAVDAAGRTAMHYAANHAHSAVMDALRGLSSKIVNMKDNHGVTPLMLLVQESDEPRLLDRFVKYGAEVDAVDDRGETALMHAARVDHANVCSRLVTAHKASMGVESAAGRTAMAIAEEHGCTMTLHMLANEGLGADGASSMKRERKEVVRLDSRLLWEAGIPKGHSSNGSKRTKVEKVEKRRKEKLPDGVPPALVEKFKQMGRSKRPKKCGACHTCLNPSLRKACLLIRTYFGDTVPIPRSITPGLNGKRQTEKPKAKGKGGKQAANRKGKVDTATEAPKPPDDDGADSITFYEAVELGDSSAVSQFLDQGFDVNQADEDNEGTTPIMYASLGGQKKLVEYLLKHGADVDGKDVHGTTALMCAAQGGYHEIIKFFCSPDEVEFSGLPLDPNVTNVDGDAALHFAAEAGHGKAVDMLLSLGANPDLKNNAHQTAEMTADQANQEETSRILREARLKLAEPAPEPSNVEPVPEPSNVEPVPEPSNVEPAPEPSSSDQEATPPRPEPIGSNEGQSTPANVRVARKQTMSLSANDKRFLRSISKGDMTEAHELIKNGGVSVETCNTQGTTALMIICLDGDRDKFDFLVKELHANPSAHDENGMTVLMHAAQEGHADLSKELLVTYQVEVNSVTEDGDTALMYAAQGGHLDVVELLVNHGADLDMEDNEGRTSLMLAAEEGHVEVVRYLMRKGTKISAEWLVKLASKN